MSLITIDGSLGEGGGQVLRTSLALSLITGRPLEVTRIRAGRPKPGLRPQHLAGVRAAAAISGAEVEGDEVGSQEIRFRPGKVKAGDYSSAIGTAGSTALLLHSIYLPLALAGGASRLVIDGGTHVPFAPTAGYLERCWARALAGLGLKVAIRVERAGFYPRGGGRLVAEIAPTAGISPFTANDHTFLEIGSSMPPANVNIHIGYARLAESIAQRMKERAVAGVGLRGLKTTVQVQRFSAPSPGVFIELGVDAPMTDSDSHTPSRTGTFTALGKRGKPAERVADEAVEAALHFLDSGAQVDRHLADQLLLPLVLARGSSSFTTEEVTSHLQTNARVIEKFLDTRVEIAGSPGQPARVSVHPSG